MIERNALVIAIVLGLAPPPVELDHSAPEKLAATFIERYYNRPDLFSIEICGQPLDDWQESVGFDVAGGVRNIAIRSCHGVGKSTTLGTIGPWFLLTRFRCKVVMTAPSAGQLFDALYAETKSILKRCPQAIQDIFDVKADRIEFKAAAEDVFLSVRTSTKDKPEALQGIHSDHVLILVDEASGVPEEVFKAAAGSLSSENVTLILVGNPTRLLGKFAKAFNDRELKKRFKRYHIGKYVHPDAELCKTAMERAEMLRESSVKHFVGMDGTLHYASQRITSSFEQDIIAEHGLDSDEYKIRVLGDFPGTDRNSFISADLVIAAMNRDIQVPPKGRKIWIIDPARYGDDGTAKSERVGPVYTKVERRRQLNTMEVAGWVKAEWDELPIDERPEEILIDVIGIGAGVADRLTELELPVREINVSESPSTPLSKCMRLRDEIYKNLKTELQENRIVLPEDDELLEDLTCFGYTYSSDGRLKIESKQELKKRGLKSPDKGDSVAMGTLIDDAAIHGGTGEGKKRSWGTPIKRGLRPTV